MSEEVELEADIAGIVPEIVDEAVMESAYLAYQKQLLSEIIEMQERHRSQLGLPT